MNTFSVLLHLFIHPKHKQISPVKPFLAGGGHWSLAEDAVVVPPWKSFLPSSPVLRGMCHAAGDMLPTGLRALHMWLKVAAANRIHTEPWLARGW